MTLSFPELGLIPEILETLDELGYTEPTPIQAEAIPHLLSGRDVLGQAQTGTGKTAAFTLPTVQQINGNDLQVLILTPTRELAIQVSESVHRYGSKLGVRVLPIYGGQSYDRQQRRLKKGVHVVVGTPGRTLDLINKRILKLHNVSHLILDEADEMLKMGFIEDVEAILNATDASTRQTILFSATLSNDIRRLAQKYMRDPLHVSIEAEEMTVANVTQRYFVVQERDKVAALCRLLEAEDPDNTLVFARTKIGAGKLADTLTERGYPVSAIHGDLPQNERERILRRFREGQINILVATDVVARGVDIPDVSHVINFDIPDLAIEYVHRIGRTGRAGRTGDAITLITPRQRRKLKQIEDYIRRPIDKGKLPTRESVLERRDQQFREQMFAYMQDTPIDTDSDLVNELVEMGYPAEYVATVAVKLLRSHEDQRPLEHIKSVKEDASEGPSKRRGKRERNRSRRGERNSNGREEGMVRFYMNVGKSKGIRPGDIVYSIASEANIPGNVIGAIDIRQNESFVDLPEAHVDAVLRSMKRGKIRGQNMTLSLADER